ncbi:DedA family protein [Candidatus Peregrinibacteria bacterium HGW-Peregrinibacteria-1]|jgi:membrane protein DedA with SNARE-associated domain|nr:MAG: DedA family protein [Candidatus Peregrinibacteria bacterium HGW-Peregrinibacteria-1]
MFESLVNFILDLTATWGYFGVFFLMVIESCAFVPFPSEVVIVPAGVLAYRGEMNIFVVIFLGTLGSVVGALVNYYFSLYVGRKVLYRFVDSRMARFMFLDREKLEKAEAYFRKNGEMTTFVGRLIPGVRQLISLPAGLAKMKVGSFVFFTALGAGLWVTVLAVQGWYLGKYGDVIGEWIESNWIWAVLLLVSVVVLWVFKSRIWVFIRGIRAEKKV